MLVHGLIYYRYCLQWYRHLTAIHDATIKTESAIQRKVNGFHLCRHAPSRLLPSGESATAQERTNHKRLSPCLLHYAIESGSWHVEFRRELGCFGTSLPSTQQIQSSSTLTQAYALLMYNNGWAATQAPVSVAEHTGATHRCIVMASEYSGPVRSSLLRLATTCRPLRRLPPALSH